MYNKSFRNLIVWQLAKELTLSTYKITKNFPETEKYTLSSQLKRSSYSIMANVAEGNVKESKKEKARFFSIAQASLTETDCGMELALDLAFIDQVAYAEINNLVNRVGYLLKKLIDSQK
jgi:four helix bundle protein